ncbi:MAG TPA: TIGR03790 family protein, partial [Candidatus Thalassarchaeaceae archaeon]
MRVTSLLILALVAIHPWTLCVQPISTSDSLNEAGYAHSSSDLSTIAVPEGFHHTTWANYSDVAVLINNRSMDSVLIGEAFAAARGIPEERIFRLINESTPTGETINAGQFDEFFADPVREMILNRSLGGEINYIVTTKGIPLRVNGGTNARASFDSELALIDSAQYSPAIHANYWTEHAYGPWSDTDGDDYSSYSETPVPIFNRIDQGFYIVTRLTGYDVSTALGLIDLANESYGSRGTTVLDLATNRNSSGYQFWNDALYRADEMVNGTLGFPTQFNQNSTYLTNVDDVIQYAAWGSNHGSWEDK